MPVVILKAKRTCRESSLAGLRNCLSCGTRVSGQYPVAVDVPVSGL